MNHFPALTSTSEYLILREPNIMSFRSTKKSPTLASIDVAGAPALSTADATADFDDVPSAGNDASQKAKMTVVTPKADQNAYRERTCSGLARRFSRVVWMDMMG